MKISWLVISTLTAILCVLVSCLFYPGEALADEFAPLGCSQIKGCRGEAVCTTGGSVAGCAINCDGYAYIQCNNS